MGQTRGDSTDPRLGPDTEAAAASGHSGAATLLNTGQRTHKKWGNPIQKYFIPLHVPTEIANMLISFNASYVVVNIFFFKYFSVANLFCLRINGLWHMRATFNLNIF